MAVIMRKRGTVALDVDTPIVERWRKGDVERFNIFVGQFKLGMTRLEAAHVAYELHALLRNFEPKKETE